MKTVVGVALVLAVLPTTAGALERDRFDSQAESAGDMLQVGVPLFALGLTFLFDPEAEEETAAPHSGWAPDTWGADANWLRLNGSPRHDLLLAIGRTELATYSLKYAVDEQRPNGHGQSFPSGHTSSAFAGAEFIRKQYGWDWGVPAYLAAGLVGWSRVEAGKHWTHDVLAGAAIGIVSNHDDLGFTLPFGRSGGQISIAPTLLPGLGAGVPGIAPADSVRALMEEPRPSFGAGLHIEVRF